MRAPSAVEVAYALYGAVRLLRRDPGGAAVFRDDAEGFWNSFFAAAIVAPGYAVLVGLHLYNGGPTADAVSTVLIHVESYVITWLAFPLAVYYLCTGLDREDHWVRFVVALNWTKVVQIALYLPLALVAASGLFGPGMSTLITLLGTGIVLVYQWYVTRTLLEVNGLTAMGLTGIDLVIGILVTTTADAALQG